MSEYAVELDGVRKAYPHFTLEDLHLQLPIGGILGVIGANGAGKSTTIRILMGLVRQERGRVRVMGHEMPADRAAARHDIGFASEELRPYGFATLAWDIRVLRSIH